ncbi:MAG: RdgB/HAM1 family non-canonical purine NTP pyrophosphatase [Chloroflexi bacterium]|nr:RdgB/HAM1 family non-canonical purine NTP pyrophosphatase [Chloroflexota bacterium]
MTYAPAARAAPSPGRRRRIVVATRSEHKLRELRDLLHLPATDLISLSDLGLADEVPETGRTFAANARLKARAYAQLTGMPALADDSGLEVDALDGGPGVRTKRYAGEHASDAENNAKLLDALRELPPERRGARYACVLAFVDPADDGQQIVTARGTTRGRIASRPRGSNGFGYDPIFEPQGEPPGGQTLGEWSAEAKNRISHRARAARRIGATLRALGY